MAWSCWLFLFFFDFLWPKDLRIMVAESIDVPRIGWVTKSNENKGSIEYIVFNEGFSAIQWLTMFYPFTWSRCVLLIMLGLSLHARRGIFQVAISALEEIIDAVHHEVEVLQILTVSSCFFHLQCSSSELIMSNQQRQQKKSPSILETRSLNKKKASGAVFRWNDWSTKRKIWCAWKASAPNPKSTIGKDPW